MANWVSAGCGVIANELAQAMEKRGQKLYGVVNRTQDNFLIFGNAIFIVDNLPIPS